MAQVIHSLRAKVCGPHARAARAPRTEAKKHEIEGCLLRRAQLTGSHVDDADHKSLARKGGLLEGRKKVPALCGRLRQAAQPQEQKHAMQCLTAHGFLEALCCKAPYSVAYWLSGRSRSARKPLLSRERRINCTDHELGHQEYTKRKKNKVQATYPEHS